MKSLPGSQPLLGEIPPKLVAGILGRSYDATPCSPHFLSASALPYSSSFCSLVLLTISFFFSVFSPFLLPFSPLCTGFVVVLLLSLVHSGGSPLQTKMTVWKGRSTNTAPLLLFHQHCFLSSCFFFAVPFLLLSPLFFLFSVQYILWLL